MVCGEFSPVPVPRNKAASNRLHEVMAVRRYTCRLTFGAVNFEDKEGSPV